MKYGLTRSEFFELVKLDYAAWSTEEFSVSHLLRLYFKTPGFRLVFWARLSNLFWRAKKTPLSVLVHYRYLRLQRSLGVELPYFASLGGGLKVDHPLGIVLNGFAVYGSNLIVKQNVTVGHSSGKVPVIGDNVWIGPNCVIVGDVVIGDNAVIGAGSVVVKSIPANAIAVGNPARVIRYQTQAELKDLHY